jgi:hypothetical protein
MATEFSARRLLAVVVLICALASVLVPTPVPWLVIAVVLLAVLHL